MELVETFDDLYLLSLEKLIKLRDVAKDDVKSAYDEYSLALNHYENIREEIMKRLSSQ